MRERANNLDPPHHLRLLQYNHGSARLVNPTTVTVDQRRHIFFVLSSYLYIRYIHLPPRTDRHRLDIRYWTTVFVFFFCCFLSQPYWYTARSPCRYVQMKIDVYSYVQ